MRFLLIFPTIFEAAPFFKLAGAGKPHLGDRASLKMGGAEFLGLVSGYGSEGALNRLSECADSCKPDFALLCGFCGACSPRLREGDFIFESGSEKLSAAFESVGAVFARIAFETSVAGESRKRALAEAGYEAVDMESGIFKKLFGEAKFASFRAVSDSANSRIPAEFFDAMIDKKTGANSLFNLGVLKVFNPFKNPLLVPNLLAFSISASKVSKVYSKKLALLLENLAKI